jgi:hypothetical protein
MHDTIESVLLTDPRYLEICDRIDRNVESMTESALEEASNDLFCHEADIVTDLDDSVLEPDDYIDNQLLDFCDEYPDLIANDDGEIIDLVAGVQ